MGSVRMLVLANFQLSWVDLVSRNQREDAAFLLGRERDLVGALAEETRRKNGRGHENRRGQIR